MLKAVFKKCNTRTNNLMRFNEVFGSQSKNAGIARLHLANLHRTGLSLNNIFFQNSNFFIGNRIGTGR